MKQNFPKILVTLTLAMLLTGAYVRAADTNERIETAAKQSYVFKTYLEKDAIAVHAKHGVVTLTGTVTEESHKSLAQETVANLPGVKSVKNELKLEGQHPAKNSDEWVALQVKTSLLFNRHVSGLNTKVAVAHGVVTLSGTAENQAQKDLTGEYAKDIQGVKEVKNELTLPKVPNELIKHTEEMIDDASITAQVKMALMSHYSTSAFATGVNTTNGVVTLTGKVDSEAGRDMAGKVTDDVKGVTKVINNMLVKDAGSKK
jgi:osmotically-inducible protein OsmY